VSRVSLLLSHSPALPLLPPTFFSFNAPATTAIYTLSLHDALPIYPHRVRAGRAPVPHRATRPGRRRGVEGAGHGVAPGLPRRVRSEEHTSELQSRENLVCRLLLEKKKKNIKQYHNA